MGQDSKPILPKRPLGKITGITYEEYVKRGRRQEDYQEMSLYQRWRAYLKR